MNMNKRIITLIIFLLIIINFKIDVFAKEYNISSNDYIMQYNVIYLNMDKAFSYLKEVYDLKTDNELADELSKLFFYKKHTTGSCNTDNNNYAYRQSNMDKVVISKNNKTIPIPDIYIVCVDGKGLMIDDSVKVEMVVKNNKYYLPTYFFANIPGVTVKIDGIEVYKANNYKDSISALKKNVSNHTVKLIVNEITKYNLLAVNIKPDEYKYYGMENGALWREEAKKRIEKNRKGDLNVTVSDQNGNSVNNATIKINMLDNNFKFGASVSRDTDHHIFTKNGVSVTSEYFNAIGSTAVFSPFHHGANKKKGQNNLIIDAYNMGINYVRGTNLYWDYWNKTAANEKKLTVGDIIGEMNDDDPNNITMIYVRKKYDEYNKDGNYTSKEKDQIDNWITILKEKLKEYEYKYIETTVMQNTNVETKKGSKIFLSVDEWDIFNELANTVYFRYYLFGEKFLTAPINKKDGKYVFLSDGKDGVYYKFSENGGDEYDSQKLFNERFNQKDYSEYIDFLVGCIEKYRSITNKLMVINESKVNGVFSRIKDNKSAYQAQWLFELINKRLKKPIDAIGFENHVHGKLYMTPNAYYNAYNKFLYNVGVDRARVTEFDMCDEKDNCLPKLDDSNKEKELRNARGKYLTDTLIAVYSNSKMELFMAWSFLNKFVKEEQDAYMKTVKDWLNYNDELKTNNGKITTRLYKGKYEIEVLVNGVKTKKVVNVNENTNNIKISVNSSSSNTTYPKGDIDGNGNVETLDFLKLRKYFIKIIELSKEELKRSDVNGDGEINPADYNAIMRILINKPI